MIRSSIVLELRCFQMPTSFLQVFELHVLFLLLPLSGELFHPVPDIIINYILNYNFNEIYLKINYIESTKRKLKSLALKSRAPCLIGLMSVIGETRMSRLQECEIL